MYSNRSFEIPRCSAGPSRHTVATPRTSRKFYDAVTTPLDISQSSLDIHDMHHGLHQHHISHLGHSTMVGIQGLAPPTPVFSSKLHDDRRHRRLGVALGGVCVFVGVALASWALHHFVVESTHTLVSQLYLIANTNRNFRVMPACILFLSLLTIVNGCLAFSRKLLVRFVHFVLSLGLIGALVFIAIAAKRAEPQVGEFYRSNAMRQLHDDYGIVPEVTHSLDYIQVCTKFVIGFDIYGHLYIRSGLGEFAVFVSCFLYSVKKHQLGPLSNYLSYPYCKLCLQWLKEAAR